MAMPGLGPPQKLSGWLDGPILPLAEHPRSGTISLPERWLSPGLSPCSLFVWGFPRETSLGDLRAPAVALQPAVAGSFQGAGIPTRVNAR